LTAIRYNRHGGNFSYVSIDDQGQPQAIKRDAADSGLIARPVSQRTPAARTLPQPAPHPPHLALYCLRRYGTFIEVPNSYRTWI
jgi:hypothetical protein